MLLDDMDGRSPSVKRVGTKSLRRGEETDHKPTAVNVQYHLFILAGSVVRG